MNKQHTLLSFVVVVVNYKATMTGGLHTFWGFTHHLVNLERGQWSILWSSGMIPGFKMLGQVLWICHPCGRSEMSRGQKSRARVQLPRRAFRGAQVPPKWPSPCWVLSFPESKPRLLDSEIRAGAAELRHKNEAQLFGDPYNPDALFHYTKISVALFIIWKHHANAEFPLRVELRSYYYYLFSAAV